MATPTMFLSDMMDDPTPADRRSSLLRKARQSGVRSVSERNLDTAAGNAAAARKKVDGSPLRKKIRALKPALVAAYAKHMDTARSIREDPGLNRQGVNERLDSAQLSYYSQVNGFDDKFKASSEGFEKAFIRPMSTFTPVDSADAERIRIAVTRWPHVDSGEHIREFEAAVRRDDRPLLFALRPMLATELGAIGEKDATEIQMVAGVQSGATKGSTRARNALSAADGLLLTLDDAVSDFASRLLERFRADWASMVGSVLSESTDLQEINRLVGVPSSFDEPLAA